MPNLQPDTSFYPKPKQQDPGDLIDLIKGVRDIQSQQSLSDALKSSRNPSTGDVDTQAAGDILQKSQFQTPEQYKALLLLQQAQREAKQLQLNTVSGYMTRLLDKGGKVTPGDIARMSTNAAEILGPQGAALFNRTLQDLPGKPGSQEWQTALQLQKNTLTGGIEPEAQVPGAAGPERTTAGREAIQRIQQGGIQPTELPPEYKADLARAGGYTDRTAPLVQVLGTLKKLGPHDFGPGTEELNTIRKLAGVAGADKTLGFDLNKADDYDRVHKALTDWTNRIGGGGTDLQQLQTIAANPNVTMQKATIQSLSKVGLSLEARQHAMTMEFQDAVKRGEYAPSQYNQWKAEFAQRYDPRAFAFPMMNEDAQRKLLKGMTPEERGRFERSYAVAKKYIVPPPEGGWYTE